MSKEYPARAASPPGRPLLPPEAEEEMPTMALRWRMCSTGSVPRASGPPRFRT